MSKSDLQARPIYHHQRDSIEAHLTIVLAALAVSRWTEDRTSWSIKKFVRTARRCRTIEIQAGDHVITAADPLPRDLHEALDRIHRDPAAHSYEAACQAFAAAVPGLCRFGLACVMVRGRAGLAPWPDRCQITRAVPGGPGARSARAATPKAPLTPGGRPPGQSAGGAWGCRARGRAGRVGVACRGGVVAVATATLICACRDRRSVIRRMVPLTNSEGRVRVHSARGGRSCGGERPGRPPAREGHQLVISAQTKPASSRAIAVTATAAGLPRAVIVL